MTTNYTLANDPAVNALIAETVSELAADLAQLPGREALEAVLLGGGYGRGEGGATPDHRPYNDLDFFIITQNGTGEETQKAIDQALLPLRQKYHVKLGIDVDFASARNLDSLAKISRSMMFQELKYRHVTVFGNEHALDIFPTVPAAELPHLEGFRLLLNRGAGLLFACQDLEHSVDFNVRNLYKCILGCHDALLVIGNAYDYSFRRRQAADDNHLYQQACRFKIEPSADSAVDVAKLQKEALTLWKESFLMGIELESKVAVKDLPAARRAMGAIPYELKLKNILLNLRYGQYRYWDMPPQLPLLLELAELLFSPSPKDCNMSGFLKRWRRFN